MSRAKIWVFFCALVLVQRMQLKKKKKGSANNKRGEEVNDSEGDIKFPKMVEVCERV